MFTTQPTRNYKEGKNAASFASFQGIRLEQNGMLEWVVFSVLCGYKLQECVHNHWSGLNVRVIKGTIEMTTTPAAA